VYQGNIMSLDVFLNDFMLVLNNNMLAVHKIGNGHVLFEGIINAIQTPLTQTGKI
jgi:hypothetical protein